MRPHFAACRKKSLLKELLLDPDWVQFKLRRASVVAVLADYDVALNILSQDPKKEVLELICGAIRLSSHVITRDPTQFASQMTGRLLSDQDIPAVEEFTKRVANGTRTTWLRPLQPTLHHPGTALIRTLTGHAFPVNAVAVTPDGKRAVSASGDHTLKVWKLGSGCELHTLTGHEDSVNAVAVTSDGQRAISASWDQTLKVWGLETEEVLATFTCDSYALCCTFSEALKLILAGGASGHLHILRLQDAKPKN
jgi:WD40 repeat protein